MRDSREIARLLTQLGYPITSADVEHRWAEWEEQGNSALVVGDDASPLLGLCQLHQTVVLHRPNPIGRITALIVEESRRRTGIGSALVRAAEARMLSSGCGQMEITNHVGRANAQTFYKTLGYENTSERLVKDLTKASLSAP